MGNACIRKKRTPLKNETRKVLTELFEKMDTDGNRSITKDEAMRFWGDRFAKVNADNFFKEVDGDGNCSISYDEFMAFWQHVKDEGYHEEDIVEELDNIYKGEAWVGFRHQILPHATKIDKVSSSMRTSASSQSSSSFNKAINRFGSKF